MLASIKSTNINTQQINSKQSIKYKTDNLVQSARNVSGMTFIRYAQSKDWKVK
jgi:hypothetical protein